MLRKRIILLAALLGLSWSIPVPLLAQQLSQCEYWFDEDFSSRQVTSISGSSATVDLTLSTDAISGGAHLFNFRVKRSDGKYSPISSQLFFKNPMAGKLSVWFDNDFSKRKTLTGRSMNGGILFAEDLDCSTISRGLHTLNYCSVTDDGEPVSGIGQMIFFSQLTNEAARIEYWFDEDFDNRKQLPVTKTDYGILFAKDLDCSGLAAGVHTLNYCVTDKDGVVESGVGKTFIQVKPSYYAGDTSGLEMMSYSVQVDDGDVTTYKILSSTASVQIPYTLDARKLSEGQHKLDMKFYNTAYASTSETVNFTYKKTPAPTVTLTATESKGIVGISLDAVPNDISYHIFRKSASGATARVYAAQGSYPVPLVTTDNPAAGKYTYFAKCTYSDASGNKVTAMSNEVAVTVKEASTSNCYLMGRLYLDDKPVTFDENTKPFVVKINDGYGAKSVPVNKNGTFFCSGISYLTGVNYWVEKSDEYEFESGYIFFDSKTTNHLVELRGKTIVRQMDVSENDLVMNEMISVDKPNYFLLEVEKRSWGLSSWFGNIEIFAVKKSDVEKAELSMRDNNSGEKFLYNRIWKKVGSSERLAVSGDGTEVLIDVENLDGCEGDYCFYFFSKEEYTNTYKLLACKKKAEFFNPTQMYVSSELTNLMTIEQKLAEILKSINIYEKGCGLLGSILAQSGINSYDGTKEDATKFIKQLNGKKIVKKFIWSIVRGIGGVTESNSLEKVLGKYDALLADINDVYEPIEKIVGWETKDELEKYYDIAKYVLSKAGSVGGYGATFTNIYSPYFEVTKKIVDYVQSDLSQMIFNSQESLLFCQTQQNESFGFNIRVKKPGLLSGSFSADEIAGQIVGIKAFMHEGRPEAGKWHFKHEYKPQTFDWANGKGVFYENGVFSHSEKIGKETICNDSSADGDLPDKFWLEITWKNGRVTRVPLLSDKCVYYSTDYYAPGNIVIQFKSHSSIAESMADEIYLMEP